MPEDFQYGLLFVAATLLPLASFVFLLLWAALRWSLRPYAKDNPSVNSFFQAIGGEVPGPGPAYVALGAIALAFVCSLIGFLKFVPDEWERHHKKHELEHLKSAHGKPHDHKHDEKHPEEQEFGDQKEKKKKAKDEKSKDEKKAAKD